MANILLVDDLPPILDTLSKALLGKGHSVVTAGNGVEAMAKFASGKFDVVITDIIMPDKEGIELIMELRRLVPDVKVIAMSGGGRTGNVEFLKMAKKLGAVGIISKPVRLAEFYATLDECLAA